MKIFYLLSVLSLLQHCYCMRAIGDLNQESFNYKSLYQEMRSECNKITTLDAKVSFLNSCKDKLRRNDKLSIDQISTLCLYINRLIFSLNKN